MWCGIYYVQRTNEYLSSGRGEIPHRRYSPRASLRVSMNRCDSDTDSIVWMREGVYGIFRNALF